MFRNYFAGRGSAITFQKNLYFSGQIPSVRLLCLFLLLPLLPACRRETRTVRPAFYCWQTRYAPDSTARAYLDALRCQTLYIKLFDIGRAEGAIQPYARLDLADTAGLAGREIVPCVFLTNAVFEGIREAELRSLSDQLAAALLEHPLYRRLAPGAEVQFDCDWTPSTRDAFFAFLQKIRAKLPPNTRLSATIRLHQYKYPKQTGVPPADRGMLMFYNTGDIDDPEARNSIYDDPDARAYLRGAPARYPLPLDLALPIFHWSLVYRDGELWKIIPGLTSAELADTAFFAPAPMENAATAAPVYTVKRATLREGHYLRPGDWVRWEGLSPAQLRDAAGLAAQFDLAPDARVAFFHLDSALIRRFPVGYLHDVCRIISIPPR
ncbi:MAG: hypothetical protein RL742_425 [Bacteroidota bacterium]